MSLGPFFWICFVFFINIYNKCYAVMMKVFIFDFQVHLGRRTIKTLRREYLTSEGFEMPTIMTIISMCSVPVNGSSLTFPVLSCSSLHESIDLLFTIVVLQWGVDCLNIHSKCSFCDTVPVMIVLHALVLKSHWHSSSLIPQFDQK